MFGGLDVVSSLLLFAISIVTAGISASTGMGGGVLFFVVLLQWYSLKVTIPIHGFVQMCANLVRTYALRRALLWRMCLPFLVGAVLGILTIMYVIQYVKNEVIPYSIILALIMYSVFKPKRLPEIKIPLPAFGLVGYVTGFLAILIGAVDPILAPFFIRDDFTPEEVVANKSFMQSVIHLAKLPVFLQLGFLYTPYLGLLALLVAGSFIGTYLGVYLLQHINRRIFVMTFKTILFLIGCNIAIKLFRVLSSTF